MDITGPNNLWRDYDVEALPLNESLLYDRAENGIRSRAYYFDGFTTIDGRVRAFLEISEGAEPHGIVLYLSSADGTDDLTRAALIAHGFAVANLDYLGKSDSKARYTLYPKSLSECNSRSMTSFVADEEVLSSRWYVWTCIARKAILLLKDLYPLPVFALGKGLGGSTVYKLGSFDDGLVACATMLNVIPNVTGQGNPIINYRAALDNNAYASINKMPLMMAICSNDEDHSLDKMSELADNTQNLKCLRIVERAFSNGIKVVYDQICDFFLKYANGTPKLSLPEVTAKNSENKLYFNINTTPKMLEKTTKVNFYASFCMANPTHRNWTNIRTVSLGDAGYLARVDVLQDEKPVYAFASLTDLDGNVSSSKMVTIIPKTLGITKQPTIKRRLIYDGSMGTEAWMSPAGGEVEIKAGPFGIDGVTSNNNHLVTFKPGDLLYRSDDDSLLQLIVSGSNQTLKIEVGDEKDKYTCFINITDENSWNKLTVSCNNFKSSSGPLYDWSKITVLEISSDTEFLISSVLWV